MVSDVVDHFRNGHFAVAELNMGFGVVSGSEVDLSGALVVQGDSALVVVEAPIRQLCCDDHGLMEKATGKAFFFTEGHDLFASSLFLLIAA